MTDSNVERGRRPVFVMGCHRSGTNLLYDTILAAGGFAVYRGYLPVHKMLIPKCGDPIRLENRKKLLSVWLRSNAFRKSGLDSQVLSDRVLRECRNGGDFIRIVMDEIARKQNLGRCAVYDPDNVLHIPRIRTEIPDALFVHIIRDGRDIAVSLKKMGGFRPFPWNRSARGLLETAIYWEWMVEKGRRYGREIPGDYAEVHYEALVEEPRETLRQLGNFLEHDLNYDRIRKCGQGTLGASNSSFRDESGTLSSVPLNRWKQHLSKVEVAGIEAMVGECLQELGYVLASSKEERPYDFRGKMMKELYQQFLNMKLWLKLRTPLGRLTTLEPLYSNNGVFTAMAPTDANAPE